jgi:hypothetical protein
VYKTDRHDITEIVLKVGLKTIPLPLTLILHSHLYNTGNTLFTDAPVYNYLFLRYIISKCQQNSTDVTDDVTDDVSDSRYQGRIQGGILYKCLLTFCSTKQYVMIKRQKQKQKTIEK